MSNGQNQQTWRQKIRLRLETNETKTDTTWYKQKKLSKEKMDIIE